MCTCEAAASSSCSARVMPHSTRRHRGVLAHREPGARLGVLRDLGHDLPRPQPRQRARAARQRLRAVEVEQDVAQVLVDRDRRVRGGVDAARDPDVDLAERDLVGDRDHGLQARPARLLEVVGGRLGRELRAEHGLAREVAVARVLQAPRPRRPRRAARPRARSARRARRASRSACPGRTRARRSRWSARTGIRLPPMMATRRVSVLICSSVQVRWCGSSSSAVRSADSSPVRSHQRPSASAAPKIATDSGSTARLSVRSCIAAVTSASIRARYSADARGDLAAGGQRLVVQHAATPRRRRPGTRRTRGCRRAARPGRPAARCDGRDDGLHAARRRPAPCRPGRAAPCCRSSCRAAVS